MQPLYAKIDMQPGRGLYTTPEYEMPSAAADICEFASSDRRIFVFFRVSSVKIFFYSNTVDRVVVNRTSFKIHGIKSLMDFFGNFWYLFWHRRMPKRLKIVFSGVKISLPQNWRSCGRNLWVILTMRVVTEVLIFFEIFSTLCALVKCKSVKNN